MEKKKIAIVGGAGTGKSKRLAEYAKEQCEQNKSLLVVAKQNALKNYLEKMFNYSGAFPKEKVTYTITDDIPQQIESAVLDLDPDEIQNRDWDGIRSIMEGPLSDRFSYDCVLVDEVQDMEKDVLDILDMMAKEYLIVTFSESQALFINNVPGDLTDYEYLNNQKFEIKPLGGNHRMTPEIYKLAMAIQRSIKTDQYGLSEESAFDTDNPNRELMPKLVKCQSVDDEVDKLVALVKEVDLNEKSLAIICNKNNGDPRSVESLKARFFNEGIEVIDDSKSGSDVGEPGLRITNPAKNKGLEYDVVMLFLDYDTFYGPSTKYTDQYEGAKYLYTAITRAKSGIYMFMNEKASNKGKPVKSYYLYKDIISDDLYEVII
ncbi:hypothetical protein SAMN02910292_01227 [Lachnospiraceae bacterium XBB2008]|nr:hypothetical protein SAMN02910292_01227 [Lachnospiraceae bacterium XBB2008]